jgi:peptidoglycan/xylan/chitin deacetylase (PgdA/CDA1 family)
MPAFSPPVLARCAYPRLRWKFPPGEKKIYISFDDGPSPEITPEILSILDEWKARATFFCLGQQAEKYPELLHSIRIAGHSTGNHTYSHPNGFLTSTGAYLDDIHNASRLIPSNLFRPPYGRIWPWQLTRVRQEFEVIMWTVMSMDYAPHFTGQDVLRHLVKHTSDGSIIVFHENPRAASKLPGILHEFLRIYTSMDYSFGAIPDSTQQIYNRSVHKG